MGGFGGADGFSNPFDIFEQFFGGGAGFGGGGQGARNRAQQGSDERADLTLDFHEAGQATSNQVSVAFCLFIDVEAFD